MPELLSREGSLSIAYQLRLDREAPRVWFVSILPLPLTANIYRAALPNSVLVVPLQPRGFAAPFVRGMVLQPEYVQSVTGLSPAEAHLLAMLLPLLTRMTLPDDILARAVKWQRDQEYEKWAGQ